MCSMNGTFASARRSHTGSKSGCVGDTAARGLDGISTVGQPRSIASCSAAALRCGSDSGSVATGISRSSSAQKSTIARVSAAAPP